MAFKKFLMFPINAKPSAPIKTAINFVVKSPATIFVIRFAEFNPSTSTKTLIFI